MLKVLRNKGLRRAAFAAAFAGVAASTAGAQQPGMDPSPYEGPRTLPGLWADAVKTGLLVICNELGCEVVDASTETEFRYELTPITVAWEDVESYEITIEGVSVTMSAEGVDELQGIPQALEIVVGEVSVNEAVAADIVREMGVESPAAELIAQELVSERLSVRLALAFGEDDFSAELTLGLLSGDEIAARIYAFLPASLRERMVADRVALDVSVLDIDVPVVRALSVVAAMDPEVLTLAPVTRVEFEFVENTLLDKAYAVALVERGAESEMALWTGFADAIEAVPAGDVSETAREAARNLVGFYGAWRETDRGMRLVIEDPRAGELDATMSADALIGPGSPYCSPAAAAGIALGIAYGAAPYVWEGSPMQREISESSDPNALGRFLIVTVDPAASDAPFEVRDLWREARCVAPSLSVELFDL